MALTDKIVKIADATRSKTGKTNKLTLDEMVTEIEAIKTEPNLQDKTVEITENGTQTITADEGYDGLNSVEVTTNVASSGEEPEIGLIFNEIDNDGFPTKITTIGYTSLPSYAFYRYSSNPNLITKNVTEIVLNEELTQLGEYAFSAFSTLKKIKIPDAVTSIPVRCFQQCSGLIQVSMKNVTSISGNPSYGAFRSNTSLKAIWIGSAITNEGLGVACFYGCTKVQKIYIDLPRSIVEAFTNYSIAFSGASATATTGSISSNVIVCNDDAGFMTKEEFDSIDWSTYTE